MFNPFVNMNGLFKCELHALMWLIVNAVIRKYAVSMDQELHQMWARIALGLHARKDALVEDLLVECVGWLELAHKRASVPHGITYNGERVDMESVLEDTCELWKNTIRAYPIRFMSDMEMGPCALNGPTVSMQLWDVAYPQIVDMQTIIQAHDPCDVSPQSEECAQFMSVVREHLEAWCVSTDW